MVKITHQRGDPQNEPKAGPQTKVRESASHHFAQKYINFLVKYSFFTHKILLTGCWINFRKVTIFGNFCIFGETFGDTFSD